MKNWIIAGLVAVIAIGGAVAIAQSSRTANIEVRVWESVNDPERNYISARPEGGSWRTLGTIPLPLTDGVSSTGRFRYGDVTLAVPLDGAAPQPRPTPTPSPTATPAPSTRARIAGDGNWRLRTSTDTLTGKQESTATLLPNTKEWSGSYYDAAQLSVRCKASADPTMVRLCKAGALPDMETVGDCETSMGFQVFFNYDTYLSTTQLIRVSYRFDDGEITNDTWEPSTTGKAAFVGFPRTFTHNLANHTSLTIRARDYNGTAHTMVFDDVRGIENILPRMACY